MVVAADVKKGLAAGQLTALIRTDETTVRETAVLRNSSTMFSGGDLLLVRKTQI
jgi:hypothetical protein